MEMLLFEIAFWVGLILFILGVALVLYVFLVHRLGGICMAKCIGIVAGMMEQRAKSVGKEKSQLADRHRR